MNSRFALLLVIVLRVLAPARAQTFHPWGEGLEPVFGALQDSDLSATIELNGRCDGVGLPKIPPFARATATASTPLTTLAEIAASDSGMSVRQESNGRIRMIEKGVPADILNVRIAHLVLLDYSHRPIYSANLAASIILDSPEVVEFMRTHDIRRPNGSMGIGGPGLQYWPPGAPHVSETLEDVTVQEAFDHVLAAFPGEILVYWNCPKPREKFVKSSAKLRNESDLFAGCQLSLLPDPMLPSAVPTFKCIPRLPLAFVLQLSWDRPEPPQRRIVFAFFAMQKWGDKKLVGGG